MSTHHPFLSRRALLKSTAAVVAGTVLLPQFTEVPTFAATRHVALKVGAVVPNAQHFPTLGRDLTAGLSLALATSTAKITLHSLHYDSTFADAYNAAETLLNNGADVIVATTGSTSSELLSDLCARAERPLIIANSGENAVQSVAQPSFTFHSTLNTWQASYALGQWAATHHGRRGMIATSYYDSGYDTVYAFEAGFTQAGGEIVHSTITHTPANSGFETLRTGVATHQPDFVYALYTNTLAHAFFKEAAASLGVPVLGSPFLTENVPHSTVYSATAWADTLQNGTNDTFVQRYTATTGITPSVFSVLGWDTGTWIANALAHAGTAAGTALQTALRSVTVDSPRGTLQNDTASQSLNGPVYLRRADGSRHQVTEALVAPTAPLFGGADAVRSGWIYPYLT
jgi:branched-chain amino acid transport system substrate-binding protein